MKTGIALFLLIGLSLIFKVDSLWPSSSSITSSQYSHIRLTNQDSTAAIESFRRSTYLNTTGFYNSFFPMAPEVKLTYKTHVYFLMGHAFLIVIMFLWAKEAAEYSRPYVLMFLFFQLGDLADYLICYNKSYSPYLSYNLLFTVLYGLFLIIMTWKHNSN